jgi:hypothetical protein
MRLLRISGDLTWR